MKKNIKILLNIIFSLIIISTGLNAKMYIENVAADNTDASGRFIPGGIDLENVEVKCWNGGNWGPSKINKNSYLTHDCGSSEYMSYEEHKSNNGNIYGESIKRTFAPADLYYQGNPIGVQWSAQKVYTPSGERYSTSKAEADTGLRELRTIQRRGTLDDRGNPHYCLKMVNGNLTVTYNGENNCPRLTPAMAVLLYGKAK